MAIVYAVKSGDWSDPTVWNTGVLPGVDDEVYANGWIITLDTDVEVLSLSNRASGGIAQSGRFVTNSFVGFDTQTITANIFAGPWPCVYFPLTTNSYEDKKLVIVGDIHGGTLDDNTQLGASVGVLSTITTSVHGNLYPGTGQGAHALKLRVHGSPPSKRLFASINGDIHANSKSKGVSVYGFSLSLGGHIDTNDETGSGLEITPTDNSNPNLRSPLGVIPGEDLSISLYEIDPETGDVGDKITLSISGGGVGSDSPSPHDVRKGIAYDGSKVGTLDVPHPNQVAFGVPTDNTVGQAAISLPQLSEITGNQISSAFDK